MTDLDTFIATMHARMVAADTALHNGDATQRIAMWSHKDPVTLFGAGWNGTGWDEILAVFQVLASRFSGCESETIEVIAADVSGDLAYMVCIEHTTASVGDAPASTYSLRVTTIFRREDGEWKVVHRHGDPYDESAGIPLARLKGGG